MPNMKSMKYDRLADADPQTPIPEPGSYSQYSRSPRPTPADDAAAAVGRDDEHLREQLRVAAAREAQVAAEVSNLRQLLSESGSASPVLRVESVDDTSAPSAMKTHTSQQPEPEPEPEPEPVTAPPSPSVSAEEDGQLSRTLTQLEQQKEGVAHEAEEELRRAQEELQSAEHRVQVELRSAHDRLLRAQMVASPVLALPEAEEPPAPKPAQKYVGVPRAPAPEIGSDEEAGERDKRFATDLKERPYYQHMEQKREDLACQEGERAMEATREETKKQVGPLVETLVSIGKTKPEDAEIKYGEIRFEENDRVVPYLIIPERKRDSDELLEAITAMKHKTADAPFGKKLSKPTAIFEVRSAGTTYLDWATRTTEDEQQSGEDGGVRGTKALREAWEWDAPTPQPDVDGRTSSELSEEQKKKVEEEKKIGDKNDFAEQMLDVTRTLTACLQESNAWLFTQAGRGAADQLIGHTIDRFRGSPEDLVWMQYSALGNPRLFGQNHELVTEQLRKSALPLANGIIPDLRAARAFYPSQRVHYPATADLHRQPDWFGDKSKEIKDLGIDIHPRATHLLFFDIDGHHGATTDPSWHSSGFGAHLQPFDHIDTLKQAMKAQGVSEGMVLMNGGLNEFAAAAHMISQLNPVIVLKNVGGASELMAHLFQKEAEIKKEAMERRWLEEEEKDVIDADAELEHFKAELRVVNATNPRTLDGIALQQWNVDKRRLERAVRQAQKKYKDEQAEYKKARKKARKKAKKREGQREAKKSQREAKKRDEQEATRPQNGHRSDKFDPDVSHEYGDIKESMAESLATMRRFVIPERADQAEMIVIDPVPKNKMVHQLMQKQVAAMKEKQIDTNERMHGFQALESRLLDQAWEDCALYSENALSQKRCSDSLEFLTNIFNVVIVLTVVVKQFYYPSLSRTPVCSGSAPSCVNEDFCMVGHAEDVAEERRLWSDDGSASAWSADDVFSAAYWRWIWALLHQHKYLKDMLIVMPIINGVLLTILTQLDPKNKWRALSWGDAALESETYIYRARALHYSASSSSGWRIRDKSERSGSNHTSTKAKTLAAKTYSERCASIKEVLHSEGTFSQAHLDYSTDSNELRLKRRLRVKQACEEREEPPNCVKRCCNALWEEDYYDVAIRELEKEIKQKEREISDSADIERQSSQAGDDDWSGDELENLQEELKHDKEELEHDIEARSELRSESGKIFACWSISCGLVRRCGNSCCTLLAGRRSCERCKKAHRSNARKMVLEEIDERTSRPKTKFHTDNGYSRLECNAYLALRLEVHRARMKDEIQPTGRSLRNLRILMAAATTVSVILGSFDKDLWIAASTALVSFFSTWLEYGDYSQRVRTTNTSIKMLEQAWQEWHGLTFHEKRQPVHFDRLVRQTEDAIMAEYAAFFQPSRTAATKESGKSSSDGDSNHHSASDEREDERRRKGA